MKGLILTLILSLFQVLAHAQSSYIIADSTYKQGWVTDQGAVENAQTCKYRHGKADPEQT